MAIIKRNQAVMWSDADNRKFEGFDPLGVGSFGSEDATLPGVGSETVFVQDENGFPLLAISNETPPSGLVTMTLNFFETYAKNALRVAKEENRKVSVQQRFHKFGVLTNPTGWTKIFHYGEGRIGDETRQGAQIVYSGEGMQGSMPVSFEIAFEFLRPELTTQTAPALVVDNNVVEFVSTILPPEVISYPGVDRIGAIGQGAFGGATAKLLVTSNGGTTWADSSADGLAIDENIVGLAQKTINPEVGFRWVIVGDGTDLAYADVTWSDPATTVWTTTALTGTGQTIGWDAFKEMLIATSSGVYISRDAGESIDSQLSTSANISVIAFSPKRPNLEPYAYLAGATNTILRKKEGNDTIDTLQGISGGLTFTALAVAMDGTLWAGNGQSLYRSSDGATSQAGWTLVKDFGSSKSVVAIGLVKDDPQFMRVIVDDATPGTSEVWLTADSVTFEQVPELTNDGYNNCYFSPVNPDFSVIVGDDDTTSGIIQKLASA